ncbi:MAG: RNase P modulator RnpM [Coriobacteriales bacterium]
MAAKTRRRPQRTCVSCGTTGDKGQLVRLVRVADGSVAVDASGKQAGRGAYVCRKVRCFEDACGSGKLSRALRTKIDTEEYDRLLVEFENVVGLEGVSTDAQ